MADKGTGETVGGDSVGSADRVRGAVGGAKEKSKRIRTAIVAYHRWWFGCRDGGYITISNGARVEGYLEVTINAPVQTNRCGTVKGIG